jgi:hypothetical protein
MSEAKKIISVIGGGLAGSLAALLIKKNLDDLSKKNKLNQRVSVVLYEKEPHIMNGTSQLAVRRHYGGEYPLDRKTSLTCLQGAMVLHQMLPGEIYTNEKPIHYLITEKTHNEAMNSSSKEGITVDQYISQYKEIEKQYQRYIDRAVNEYKDRNKVTIENAKNEVEKLFFGPSGQLSRVLKSTEAPLNQLKPDYFAGGIASKEIGFNPAYLGTIIEILLQEANVSLVTNAEITKAKVSKKGLYTLSLKSHDLLPQDVSIDYVINASWDNIFKLEEEIDTKSKGKIANIFLRGMMILDISSCALKPDGIFSLLGESGGMYNPLNDKIAWLCYLTDECTYIDQCEITDKQRNIPEKWNEWLNGKLPDQDKRLQKGLQAQIKKFPFLEGAKPLCLKVGTTISFNEKLSERHHCQVEEVGEGWLRVLPTKATYTGLSAIETLQSVFKQLVKDNILSKKDAEEQIGFSLETSIDDIPVILSENLQLRSLLPKEIDLSERVKNFVKERKLHPYLAEKRELNESYWQEFISSQTTKVHSL